MANRMLEEDPPRYTRASDPGEARLRGKDAPSSWLLCTDTDICDAFVGVKFKYTNAHQRCLLSTLFQFRNKIKKHLRFHDAAQASHVGQRSTEFNCLAHFLSSSKRFQPRREAEASAHQSQRRVLTLRDGNRADPSPLVTGP